MGRSQLSLPKATGKSLGCRIALRHWAHFPGGIWSVRDDKMNRSRSATWTGQIRLCVKAEQPDLILRFSRGDHPVERATGVGEPVSTWSFPSLHSSPKRHRPCYTSRASSSPWCSTFHLNTLFDPLAAFRPCTTVQRRPSRRFDEGHAPPSHTLCPQLLFHRPPRTLLGKLQLATSRRMSQPVELPDVRLGILMGETRGRVGALGVFDALVLCSALPTPPVATPGIRRVPDRPRENSSSGHPFASVVRVTLG